MRSGPRPVTGLLPAIYFVLHKDKTCEPVRPERVFVLSQTEFDSCDTKRFMRTNQGWCECTLVLVLDWARGEGQMVRGSCRRQIETHGLGNNMHTSREACLYVCVCEH